MGVRAGRAGAGGGVRVPPRADAYSARTSASQLAASTPSSFSGSAPGAKAGACLSPPRADARMVAPPPDTHVHVRGGCVPVPSGL